MSNTIQEYHEKIANLINERASLRDQLDSQKDRCIDLFEKVSEREDVIRELIPIAEKQMDYEKDRKHIFLKGPWPYEQYKAIIEKAKSLTTKDK